ncbi:MAG: hypothetical protein MJ110_01560 [Lachnospiraceae bacterium]|nr:hypothetical protein [Lachnospiraceae bacterium]
MVIWFKTVNNSKIIASSTWEDLSDDTRTHKVFSALEDTCNSWDLAVPVWLDINIEEFKSRSKTRFTKDSFVEEVPFDYLEMQVLEEDIDAG